MSQQLIALLWKNVYVRRFRRHLILTLAQIVFAFLIILTLKADVLGVTDISDDFGYRHEPSSSADGESHEPASRIAPATTFRPFRPLDEWSAGAADRELCYVPGMDFFVRVAERAAELLNITTVTRLNGTDEVAPYIRSKSRAGVPKGSIIAIVFNTSYFNLSETRARDKDEQAKRQNKPEEGVKHEGPLGLDYTVLVSGLEFDVNVHYRRFLIVPLALNLESFTEMTHLMPVQYAVETAVLEGVAKAWESPLEYEVSLQRFPYPSIYPEVFRKTYARIVLRFVLAFWIPFMHFVVQIVDERSSGMRELQRIYDVGDLYYWLSHYLSMETFVALLGALVLLVPYNLVQDDGQRSFVVLTNPAIFYIVTLFFGSALAVHAMFLSLFFSSSIVAGLLSSIYWFLSLLLPYAFLQSPQGYGYYLVSSRAKLLTCPLPGMFLHWCFMVIERLERFAQGGRFENFASRELTPDNVTLLELILMSTYSNVVLLALMWYIDEVTTCHGSKIAKPWNFLFKRTYWKPPVISGKPTAAFTKDSKYYEPEPANARPIVSFNGVSKSYGQQVVLNDINLNLFGHQITVLLAPKDSGKTTFMKLLTGCTEPSSGTISVGSYDIVSNTAGARKLLSYCPRGNVLCSELTVEEHLTFFGVVKGIAKDSVGKGAARIMTDTGLGSCRAENMETLTYGLQQFVGASVAIMPFPDVQMIVLDEPTKHMDPRMQRELWEVLFKVRRYKGVFLTTNDYAEAEALADRIAVLHNGRLYCVGSPEYFKSRFGMGYMLRLRKGQSYQTGIVEALIRRHFFNLEKLLDNRSSVVYRLTGDSDMLSGIMREVFYDLEESKDKLGVAKLSITVSTLQDVLESISERRSAPGSMQQSLLGIGSGANTPFGGVSRRASIAEGGVHLQPGGPAEDPLRALHERNFADAGVPTKLRCMLHKRSLDYMRTFGHHSARLVLPMVLLLLGGYFESFVLGGSATHQATLTYDVVDIVGTAFGFCGASAGGRFQRFMVEHVCPLMTASGVPLREVAVTDVESQLLAKAKDDVYSYIYLYQMGVVSTEASPRITLWFNGQNPHSALLALNLLHTAILRNLTGNAEAFIRLTNTPDSFQGLRGVEPTLGFFRVLALSSSTHEDADYAAHVVIVRVLGAVFVPTALCYHAAHFVLPVLTERQTGAKHLQLMTGLSGLIYWMGHFLFDACICLLHTVFLTLAAVAFRTYLGWHYIRVLGSLVMTAADTLLFYAAAPSFQTWVEVLLSIPIRWLPTYIVTRGLTKLILLFKESLLCSEGGLLLERYCQRDFLRFTQTLEACCPQNNPQQSGAATHLDPLSVSVHTGFFEVIALLLEGCFCFFMANFLDSDMLQRLWSKNQDRSPAQGDGAGTPVDDDVVKEVKRVDQLCSQRTVVHRGLIVRGLTKAYGFLRPSTAVDRVSFAVNQGECFGLVGVLGTGKSSLVGMLAGELFPTSGDAFMHPLSLSHHYRQWMRNIGYVPYSWGLLDTFTGREMIHLLASLRGVRDVPRTMAHVLQAVELSDPDARVSSYSAGAKTQLALALALVTNPRLYLLDLPELDTAARTVVLRIVQNMPSTSSVVLTCEHLHHFEAVCDRIAILVAGHIECIGSVRELRDKYCRGITITIYTFPDRKYDLEHQRAIALDMMDLFPTSTLARCYEGLLEFRLAELPFGLCEMFDRLLYLKRMHKFHIFYVSETTLDQIFLSLGRKHAGIKARQ